MKKLLTFFLVVLSAIAFNRCNPYDTVTVTDVTVNPAALTLAPEETATLKATVIPDYATNKSVIWESGNEDVATVDAGTVTAHATGTTTITATTVDGLFTATCAVTVTFSTLRFTVNEVEFFMEPVEGGTFQMGNPYSTHQVTLSDYYVGKFEVTQGLWEAVMDNTWPGAADENVPNDTYGKGADYPAYYVNWNDIRGAGGFLETLNTKLATELGGRRFALPTEAQWEYAAAGGKAGYNTNGTRKHLYSGSRTIGDVAWYVGNTPSYGEDGYGTQPVGTAGTPATAANELGIYDMSGNVWEWCADWYGPYGTDAVIDPTGPATSPSDSRVLRGGSWYYLAQGCVVSCRAYDFPDSPDSRLYDLGFRLALVLP